MNDSMASVNSCRLIFPSLFLSTDAMISRHFLSSSYLSLSIAIRPLACLRPSPLVPLVGNAVLNSSISMNPSLLLSNSSKALKIVSLVTIFLCFTAAVKNSWKSIFPSPSRSHYVRTSFHFPFKPATLSSFSYAFSSSVLICPSWSISSFWKAILSRCSSVLSDVRPVIIDSIDFWNLVALAKFYKLCSIYS